MRPSGKMPGCAPTRRGLALRSEGGADELLSTGFAGLDVEICYGQLVSLTATVSARGK